MTLAPRLVANPAPSMTRLDRTMPNVVHVSRNYCKMRVTCLQTNLPKQSPVTQIMLLFHPMLSLEKNRMKQLIRKVLPDSLVIIVIPKVLRPAGGSPRAPPLWPLAYDPSPEL